MPDIAKLKQARDTAAAHGQTHLFRFFDELPPEEQTGLIDQVLAVDFAQVAALHRDLVLNRSAAASRGVP